MRKTYLHTSIESGCKITTKNSRNIKRAQRKAGLDGSDDRFVRVDELYSPPATMQQQNLFWTGRRAEGASDGKPVHVCQQTKYDLGLEGTMMQYASGQVGCDWLISSYRST